MKTLLQRVSRASVSAQGRVAGEIGPGLLALVSFGKSDTEEDLEWMSRKITGLRIFPDSNNSMNLSVSDIGGDILIVSQFTLHADSRKGRRPSFMNAALPGNAELLYKLFLEIVSHSGVRIQSGVFGAMMKIDLVNDGPVTIMVDSPSERSG
ncbi:D-tyrosyl-tRNA(Tyr) deacylase [Candidatus Fermentibacteria bacterium]|nr:MAG: D-tyrosyl-tRNA(Tyr) deacylase [Candidatus Fermentibacteria bacterium]